MPLALPSAPFNGGVIGKPLLAPNGTATAPGISFANDSDTGFSITGTNSITFSAGGTNKFTMNSGGISMSSGATITLDDGTLGGPGLSFISETDTGIYRPGANRMGLVVGGTNILDLSEGSLTVTIASQYVFITSASVAGRSGFRLPHGTAPTSPVNGDLWTTTVGVFARINGATVQLATV